MAFGYYLMNEEFLQSGPINFSISAIMAHEFSHIVQFKRGSELGVTQRELQADYLAGWYVGKRQSHAIPPGSLENIVRSFFEHGSYDFNNPQFHGTPEQRVDAVMNGFHHSDVSLSSAYATAESFVQGTRVDGDSDRDSESSAGFGNQRNRESDLNSGKDALTRVITLAERNDLGDLKGERDSVDWTATINLPFAKFCNIQRESSSKAGHVYVYTCAVATKLDHDDAQQKSDELVRMLTEQFPGMIRKTPREHGTSHTEYLQTRGGAYINVRSFPSQAAYAVRLDVAPPQSD